MFSTDTMLALQTLAKPLFPLVEINWRTRSPCTTFYGNSELTPARITTGFRFLNSDLSGIFPQEWLEIIREVQELAGLFEVIDQIVTTPEQLDDLEYRCVAVQHRLLSYNYSCQPLDDLSPHITSIIRKLCLITTLIFFGKYLLSHST